MELISFIKGLLKKGKVYHDVWLPILFELEEKKLYKLNQRLDISKSQYYRIISFGVELWAELVPSVPLEYKRGNLFINVKTASKKTLSKTKAEKVQKEKKQVEEVDMNMVYESIISYLNQKAKTGYQSTTNSYRTYINARIKAGAKLEDFYTVIDNKCADWMGTDFEKFIRPETLFGNKFDTYLNQIISKKTNQEIAYDKVSEATKLGWGS
jgi:uncharacterized phage protein (TIGR02220 family)